MSNVSGILSQAGVSSNSDSDSAPRRNAQYRNWLFTWNNYPPDYRSILDGISCTYICAGEEVAPTSGTPHLQGFVAFSNRGKQLGGVRRVLPGCHLTSAKGSAKQNRAYCSKTRDCDDSPNLVFYERGQLPLDAADKGALEKVRYEDAWNYAKLGEIESIAADIRIRCYSALRRIERDYMPAMGRLDGPCGVWIHGLAGCGKTRTVMDTYPELYPKPRNIWWDGYQNEPVVLLDDVDVYDVKLGGLLKHWADAYPFIGEAKGTSRKIRPLKFFVTSQYRIEDIWTDAPTREALNRRFVVIEKVISQGIII